MRVGGVRSIHVGTEIGIKASLFTSETLCQTLSGHCRIMQVFPSPKSVNCFGTLMKQIQRATVCDDHQLHNDS